MITQGVDQFECAKGVKPGVHLPGKLVQIPALLKRMVKCLIRTDFFQACQ